MLEEVELWFHVPSLVGWMSFKQSLTIIPNNKKILTHPSTMSYIIICNQVPIIQL